MRRPVAGRLADAGGQSAREQSRGFDTMSLFMDVHNLDGPVTAEDVAKAHAADLQAQDENGVHYLGYWVDADHGKIFCLVDAPSADAAATVHREAHGLVADEIYQVAEGE